MHAPVSTIVVAAVLGVIVPLAGGAMLAGNAEPLAIVIRIASLAAVPVLVARIAYRQGYDRGAACAGQVSGGLGPRATV